MLVRASPRLPLSALRAHHPLLPGKHHHCLRAYAYHRDNLPHITARTARTLFFRGRTINIMALLPRARLFIRATPRHAFADIFAARHIITNVTPRIGLYCNVWFCDIARRDVAETDRGQTSGSA